MKSKINYRKLIVGFGLLTFIFFNFLSLSPVNAKHVKGNGATFELEKENPLGYGVILSAPNMIATISIDGANQGEFLVTEWDGSPLFFEEVDAPGEDISIVYPWYFENGGIGSLTNNDYIDPWSSVEWLNISAFNAEAETLSPFTLNTAFDYYVMHESSTLKVPLNHSIPMQIDIIVEKTGPKVLKADWLTDDPANMYIDNKVLITPSGKMVDLDFNTAVSHAVSPAVEVFDYYSFVAHETGTYRMMVYAAHIAGKPAYLYLDFLSISSSSLSTGTLAFGGNSDSLLSIGDSENADWQSQWFSIDGNKGDIFRFELNRDYATGYEPLIYIWSRTKNGYIQSSSLGMGIHEIYFPSSGRAYISFTDAHYADWYRYSLYLSKYSTISYSIGDPLTTLRISRDQSKIIRFSVAEDSFIRFNFTSLSDPPGLPYLDALGNSNAFILINSEQLTGYDIIDYIKAKQAGSEWFYYYYMPAGTYKAVVKNTDETKDGVFQISSKFVETFNDTIPVNDLTYPTNYPSQDVKLSFDPDEFYGSLKQALAIDIEIPETGQYRLNTTVLASDNLATLPTLVNPAAVVYYNASEPLESRYYDYTSTATTLHQSFPAFTSTADYLYIAYPNKWHDMHFNLSQNGLNGGVDNEVDIWRGNWNYNLLRSSDTTGEFSSNGTWVMNIYGDATDFSLWERGCDFDLPNIDEDAYYWLRFDVEDDYDGAGEIIPYIDLIQLSNVTTQGDVNFALIGENGYDYADYWYIPSQPSDVSVPFLNQEAAHNSYSDEQWMFYEVLSDNDPRLLAIEPGTYKLLIIPDNWDHDGSIDLRFAIENFWTYRHQLSYDVSDLSPNPNLYKFQINNYTSSTYGNTTGPFYNYGLTTTMNYTEMAINSLYTQAYFVVEVDAMAYQWTQLVVATENVSTYDLYVMQDLQWQDGASPNNEVELLLDNQISNTTVEFGAITDHFYLVFEFYGSGNDISKFMLSLSQYETIMLTTTVPVASYVPPLDPLIIILAIVIPAAVGAVVAVLLILKKKGKIMTKRPK